MYNQALAVGILFVIGYPHFCIISFLSSVGGYCIILRELVDNFMEIHRTFKVYRV